MGRAWIGISGWRYPPWRKKFYPDGLPQKDELHYASRQVNSIEINGSFYSLQRSSSYEAWRDETPDDFCFAVKGGRYITHMRRLKDVDSALANYFASGIGHLREKLGPILWQFPPSFAWDGERLESFFKLLPRDLKEAAALARRHDGRLRGEPWTRATRNAPLRHAIEIRHDSFKNEEFIDLLRRHNIAIVVVDTAGKWPRIEDVTADFVYVRLHGDKELYVSGYTDAALKDWARRIRAWRKGGQASTQHCISSKKPKQRAGRDVFVYFDNDVKVHAPFDAINLAKMLRR